MSHSERSVLSAPEAPETTLGRALLHLVSEARGSGTPDDPRTTAAVLVREGASLLSGTDCAICFPARGGRFEVVAGSGRLEALCGAVGALTGEGRPWAEGSGGARHLRPADLRNGELGRRLIAAGARIVHLVPIPAAGTGADVPALYLTARPDDREITPAEAHVIDGWAALVGVGLARARQRQEAEAARRVTTLGLQLALDAGGAAEPAEVNARIVARATEAVAADRASLIRADGRAIVVEAVHERDPERLGPAPRPFEPVGELARLLATQEAVLDVRVPLDHLPDDVREPLRDVRHTAILPLWNEGEVAGHLVVHRRRREPFGRADLDSLRTIGRVGAMTLRNARLLADLQGARTAMSDFLNLVVHDLRTPLTILAGYLSMISEGVFGPPHEDLAAPLEMMEGKVHEAQRLLDDLLMAARLESGKLPSRPVPVDVAESSRRAAERAAPKAALLQASIEPQAGEPVWACADPDHLDRILDNLVNNALEHGGDHPHVVISAVGSAGPAIVVQDSGRGVAPAERERIFDRFYRGRGSTSGVGLGLFISRQMAETFGARLDLVPGDSGASFMLRLQPARA